MMRLVIDTNVFVSALRSADGASQVVIQRCLQRRYEPSMSLALFAEYLDVMGRDELFAKSPLNEAERHELFAAFFNVCKLSQIYFLWRPNLRDEADNHVVELAVAAGVDAIVTHNRADFIGAQLRFQGLQILSPADLLNL